MKRSSVVFWLMLQVVIAQTAIAWDGLSILGDSISTGAGSHPRLEFDSAVLWRVVSGELSVDAKVTDIPGHETFGIQNELQPPRRLWPSARENDGASGWVWLHAVQAMSRKVLDTEEYSYGYLTGRGLGLKPDQIWFAGDNGTRSQHAVLHAARLIEAGEGELPTRIMMLYSGNDLCAQSWDAMTEAQVYGDALKEAMLYLSRNGRTPPDQTTVIYIPAFLPVTALLNEPSISEKKIKFYGTETTCSEVRKRMFTMPDQAKQVQHADGRYAVFAQFMPPNPALLCPTMFSQAAEDPTRQSQLANRIRAYREAQKTAVQQVNEWMAAHPRNAKIEARYLDQTESIRFVGEDVAGDCFHLSPAGHAKVASFLLKNIK